MPAETFRTVNETARPAAIEEPLNSALVHPAARALLPLAVRLGIAPNAISIAGIGFGVLAALAYQHYADWRFALGGLAAMLCWHVLDGLDGMVARATGRTSAFGRFLDGFCDYSVYILVYCSLAIAVTPVLGAGPSWSLAIGAGAAHVVQAAYYEAQRERFIRRVAGTLATGPKPVAGGFLEAGYNSLQGLLLPDARALDERLAADSALRSRFEARLLPVMRASNVLGATGRTLAIAAASLAGQPALYWIWEISALSLALVFVERERRRREASLIG